MFRDVTGGGTRLRYRDRDVGRAVERIARDVAAAGGRALAVGGCVRDAALGRPVAEVDLEVFGLAPRVLLDTLARRFQVRVVGRDFPVAKLARLPIDVSVPRRAGARGEGPAGFEAGADPGLSVSASLARRDFTVNAVAQDPLSGERLDPHGGLADLEARRLRHTSDRFGEDPLRVLRAVQLVARFDLDVDPATTRLCRTLEPADAPPERVLGEWRKLVLQGVRISRGLAFLRESGWLRFTPELEALVGCPQDSEWHPEGDVWVHTLHCMDAFAMKRLGDPVEDWIVGLAVLCHDLGKPDTTERRKDGRIIAHGHEARGAEVARRFLGRLTNETSVVEAVAALVAAHLAPAQLHRERDRVGDAAIRRLARRVGRIDRLVRVAAADHAGRPPLHEPFPAGSWLLERARALAVERSVPPPLLRGRDLLRLGLEPGPAVGRLLDACYEAQIEGRVGSREEALDLARRLHGASGERS